MSSARLHHNILISSRSSTPQPPTTRYPSNLTPQANSTLQKVCKAKSVPPFLKTFARRLIRRALVIAERASRWSTHIDQHCTNCEAIENGIHLFFSLWYCDNPPAPPPQARPAYTWLLSRTPIISPQTNTCLFCTLCPHSCTLGKDFPVGRPSLQAKHA
jgi:hypothetical protein